MGPRPAGRGEGAAGGQDPGAQAWVEARARGAPIPKEHRTYEALSKAPPIFPSPEEHPVVRMGSYATLTAANPRFPSEDGGNDALISYLLDHGVEASQIETIDGQYGDPEPSIIVYDPPRDVLFDAGRRFGQESVLVVEGRRNQLVFTNGELAGKAHPGSGHERHEQRPDDYFSRVSTGAGDLFWTNALNFKAIEDA